MKRKSSPTALQRLPCTVVVLLSLSVLLVDAGFAGVSMLSSNQAPIKKGKLLVMGGTGTCLSACVEKKMASPSLSFHNLIHISF